MVNSLRWQTGVRGFALQNRRQPGYCAVWQPQCVCAAYNENAFEIAGHVVSCHITLTCFTHLRLDLKPLDFG